MDIVTDIDEWLTSDKTEQEIVDFVKELCHALGSIIPGFEATCNFLMESQLPGIIDGLVGWLVSTFHFLQIPPNEHIAIGLGT